MSWLRDPVWQFAGVIISLIALWVTFFVYKKQQSRRRIVYEIVSNIFLVNVEDEIKSKLEIFFDKKLVENVTLLLIKIANLGDEPIVTTDYETPITIEFGESSDILETSIESVSPEDLNPEVTNTKSVISILPLLLNPQDAITIKVLVANFDGVVNVLCRIAGVPTVEQQISAVSSPPLSFLTASVYLFGILSSVGCWGVVVAIKESVFSWYLFSFMMIFLGALLAAFYIYYIWKTWEKPYRGKE